MGSDIQPASPVEDMVDQLGANPQSVCDAERFLVARLRAGDSQAFTELITRYTNQLTRFAFYTVGSRDAADDIVQQMFVELWERRSTLAPDQLKPYLFRAVRYRALNERRSQGVRQRHRTDVEAAIASHDYPVTVQSSEEYVLTLAVVQAAVEVLPERRQLAIRLRLEEEMTYPEIAEVIGVTPMAAQRLVARAMAELRELLRKPLRAK